MHIKINKNEFLNGVKLIESGIQKNKLKLSMEGIKIKTDKDSITLIAANLDFIIEHKIKCEIIKSGAFITRISEIKEFLKYIISENNTIEIYSQNDNIIIKTDHQEFKTKLFKKDEFPNIQFKGTSTFVFDKVIFLSLIEKSKMCASQSSENLAVNCIRLEIENNLLKLISTNTYRMLYLEEEIEEINSNKTPISISIPLEAINALIRTLQINSSNLLTINIGEDRIKFKISNTTIISRKIELPFPDYKSIMQNIKTDKTAVLKKSEFIQILKQLISISKKNYEAKYSIIMNFIGNILNIESNNDYSSANVSLLCQKSGEDLKLSLNSKFLIEAIQILDFEYIEMKMSGSRDSVIIKKLGNEKTIYITMPLAVRE